MWVSLLQSELSLNLLLQNSLERFSIGSEFANTFPELLNSHLILVEVEAEQGLLVEV